MSTMSNDDVYAAVIRHAAHDALRALQTTPPDSLAGSLGLRAVTDRLAAAHGTAAVRDLAEELAVDLAEALAAIAAAEAQPAPTVLDGWFLDGPPPRAATLAADGRDHRSGPDSGDVAEAPRGGAA